MPTYEYQCTKCNHAFEAFQGITAKPLSKCPKCKGKVKRLIGRGAGIIFKGSGFYQTDYRSDSYRSKAKEESASSSAASPAPAPETKTSETPAAKPASDISAKPKSEPKSEPKKSANKN